MGNSQQHCSKSPSINVIDSIDKNAKIFKNIKKSITTNSLATSNRTNLNEKTSLNFSGSSEFSKKYSKLPTSSKSINCFSFTNSNSSLTRNDLVGITPSTGKHINISETISRPSNNGFLKRFRQRIASKKGYNSKIPISVTESAISDIKRTNYISLQEIRAEENDIEIELETKRIDVRRSPGIYDLSEFAKNITLKELYEYEDKLESDYKEKGSDSEYSSSDSCFEESSLTENSSKSSSPSSDSNIEFSDSKSFNNCLTINKENVNYKKKIFIPNKLDECDEEEGAAFLSSNIMNNIISEDFSFIDQCETARSSGSIVSSRRLSINYTKQVDLSESAYLSESLSQSFFKHQNFFHQHFSSNSLNSSTPLKFLNEVNKKLISFANSNCTISKNHIFEQFDDSRDSSIINRKDENMSDGVSLFTNQIAPLATSETTTLSNSNDNIGYQYENNKISINLFDNLLNPKSENDRKNNTFAVLA